MNESSVRKALRQLLEAGLVRKTGLYRNGCPIYQAVPESELTDRARASLKELMKGAAGSGDSEYSEQ